MKGVKELFTDVNFILRLIEFVSEFSRRVLLNF